MTVQTDVSRVDYTGNGVTPAFAVPFRFLENSHLLVIRTVIATGAETTLVLDGLGSTGYTVSGANQPNGGTVTTNVAPAVTEKLTILLSVPVTQLIDYIANDPFPAESHERGLDKLTMIAKAITESLSRALKLPASLVGASSSFPSPSALKGIRWNAAANGLENFEISPFTAPSGSDNVGFIQAGTGAVARTSQGKMRDIVSITDFAGADITGATASDAAIASAIAALPAAGGDILVPAGTWKLDATPSMGTKSIQWHISAGATFTGTVGGTNVEGVSWPRANTNYTLVPFGIFNQVRTSAPLTTQAPASALFEALQPAGYNGNSVAIYAGARGSSATGNVWAFNPLVSADAGAGGTYHCIEADVNCFSAGALVKGIGISGVGTQNPDVALEITHQMIWTTGIDMNRVGTGIRIGTTVTSGIEIAAPAAGAGSALLAKQIANGNETITLQRFTDSSPTGNFLRFRDAANSADLFSVNIGGIATAAGFTTTGTVDTFNAMLRFAAPAGAAGIVGLGNGTSNTVGAAGGAAALPATPLVYWSVTVNGTAVKIPCYNA